MLCFLAICADVKYCDKKFKTLLLSVALVIQVVDVSDYAAEKHVQFGQVCHYESSMQGENREYIKNHDIVKHWYILTGMGAHEKYTVVYEALKEGISLNGFPFAHIPDALLEADSKMPDFFEEGTAYLWKSDTLPEEALKK